MKEKRKMSLNKDNKKSYKGNVGIVIRKILAVALSIGLMITAAEAIRLFNQWYASRHNETNITVQQEEISMEEVKALVEEYRAAGNDETKISALNEKLKDPKYMEALYRGFKEEMVIALGLDPEKVEVFEARDGIFLIDKTRVAGKLMVDHTGQINPAVKYLNKEGKNPPIPKDMKDMYYDISRDFALSGMIGIETFDGHYSNLEYLQDYQLDLGDDVR